MQAPVAFFIFNRPAETARVFAEIERARPRRLLVIADGPRASHVGEAALCEEARSVAAGVNWECEVLTNFAEANLGCRARVVSGLEWVFDNCGEAVVLEDDCLPHPSFFPFCDELLERYREDERVMSVCGDNYLLGRRRTRHSYFFQRLPGGWGWATWRRAWRHYDALMKGWPGLRDAGWLDALLGDARAARYWQRVFERTFAAGEKAGTWDYQWVFSIWARGGLVATAGVNLVSNIGWGPGATHTTQTASALSNIPTEEMEFPLRHPPEVLADAEADRLTFENIYLPEMLAEEPRGSRLRRVLLGLS